MDLAIACTVMSIASIVAGFGVAGWLGKRQAAATMQSSSDVVIKGDNDGSDHERDEIETPTAKESAKGSGQDLATTLMLLFLAVAFAFLYLTKDRLGWARVIPSSAAIVWSNLTVPLIVLAAGCAYRLPARPRWRRVLNASALGLLAALALAQPILLPVVRPTAGGDVWARGDVCIQSRTTTCSAAAAATLLRAHQVQATERDLARWCLTDATGTLSLGLWRGLSLATKGSDVKPRVVTATVDDLIKHGPWPCVLSVGLPARGADPVYVKQYGWSPGFRHSVILFGRKADGLMDIGDPSIGRETWAEEDVRVLWRGEAIQLVER